jgi:hypothetical protein
MEGNQDERCTDPDVGTHHVRGRSGSRLLRTTLLSKLNSGWRSFSSMVKSADDYVLATMAISKSQPARR